MVVVLEKVESAGQKNRRERSVGSTEDGSRGIGKKGCYLFSTANLGMRLGGCICGNRGRREDLWAEYLVV